METKDRILEGSFERRRRLEANGLGRFDLDGLASLRVTASSCRTIANFESAEADQLDAAVFLDAFGDVLEDSFDGFLCCVLRGVATKCILACFCELSLVHID